MAQRTLGGVLALVGGLLFVAGMACTEPQSDAKHSEPMGSGSECSRNMGRVVTEQYLADHGLHYPESSPQAAMTVGLAMIEVCAAGPPSLSVDTGALRVAEWLRDYEQGDFLD